MLDPLTGLLTRRALDERIAYAVTRAQEGGTGGAAFLLVDVDRFKLVNDEHGHAAGDDALVHIARLLERHSGPGAVVGRMGGDELAVLLPDRPYGDALHTAHDLVDAVRAAPLGLEDGTTVPLSISVGAAHVPDHAATPRSLYARADEALYEVKRAGRGWAGRLAPPHAPAQVLQGARAPGTSRSGRRRRLGYRPPG
jgi:diguanylate cyclase (GGDEF)-like protein